MEQPRSQNARTPVFKLTDKLLLSIIHLLNPAWFPSEWHAYHASDWVATVRAISQVCFRWRIVSISDPSLWNFFNLRKGSFKWIEELCHRSADAPFLDMVDDAHWDDHDGRLDQIFATVPNILPRIRFLHARISVDVWMRILERCTQLEDLNLTDFDQYSSLPATPDAPPRILLCPFNRNPPPLRTVSLHHSDVDLCLPFFSNVSDLSLCSGTFSKSLSQLPSIIKNMPHLERLKLSLQDEPFFPSETNLPLIPIPRLRYFQFGNLELLKCFELSQDCILRHVGSYTRTSTKPMINRFIWAHIANRNPYLHISVHAYSSNLIIDNRRSLYERSETLADYDLLYIGFRSSQLPTWVSVFEELMFGISDILPTIVFLELDVKFNTDWEYVVPYLHQYTRVESLYLINRNKNPNLLRSLQISSNTGAGNTILFPSLRNFVQTHLTKPLEDQVESYLDWRLNQGAAIEYLEIQNPESITCMGQDYIQELEGKYGLKIKPIRN